MKECVCICYQGDTQGGSTDLGVGTWFLILSLRRALRDLGQMASVPVPSFPDLQAWISTFIQTGEAAAEDKSPPEEQGMGGGARVHQEPGEDRMGVKINLPGFL